MSDKTLWERCSTNTNKDSDTFVGIKAENDRISVNFPLGFNISQDEKALRSDILLLLNVLSKNTDKRESKLNTNDAFNDVKLPIHAYLHIISDFYARGYYKETESIHVVAKHGKVNWSKTVKTQRAFIQNNELYYLDFVTKKKSINENEIITLIHESCVYESFVKLGWLFTSYVPEKPRLLLARGKHHYAAIIKKKLADTFNDRNRQLLKSMLSIINSLGDEGAANEFRYGTYRFEYVWEAMIDKAFGIAEKERYFPKTRWVIGKKKHNNASLEPDTIMLANDSIYVLDAKYYKFGRTGNPAHLPESTSINKQITYGEYIAETERFKSSSGSNPIVYNAFLMPYDSFGEKFYTEEEFHYIGSAFSDWKSSQGIKPYEEIAGILLDVKSLMNDHSHSDDKIMKLAALIEESVEAYDG